MLDAQGNKAFRILSLDGGGTFSLIQAQALNDLYPNQSGHEVLSHFDLVAGCSGGAIVAAALIEDVSPRKTFELFDTRENRIELFSELAWYKRLLRLLTFGHFGTRFSTKGKLAFLHRTLPKTGKMELSEIDEFVNHKVGSIREERGEDHRPIQFLFVSYDYDRNRSRMLRSNYASRASNFPKAGNQATLAEAAHASSTAPINWFDSPATFRGRRYWDGAMTGYNNPVLAAVTEAIAQGERPENIRVLALGTSTVKQLESPPSPGIDSWFHKTRPGRFLKDLKKAATLVLADPPDAHTFISHVVLKGTLPENPSQFPCVTSVIRMNPVVPAGTTSANGWSQKEFERLLGLDVATTKDDDVKLIKRLADEWMQGHWPNQAIRSSAGPDGTLEIGHARYGDAKAAWGQM